MIVYDEARHPIQINPPVYEGGEGVICPVVAQPAKLAKIYKPQKRVGRETKLRWMVASPPPDPGSSIGHASIAWPETLLYDGHGTFLGYVMPRVADTRTLLHVLNPRLRAQTLPGFDSFYLHRAARNLSAALGALHERDYIVGDLNESNILVTPQALITVIDADSFQGKEQREDQIIFYPCPVGRPEYTPPELQGKKFQGEVREPNQDAFALAVLIFQLLMGGSHPFRGAWLGSGDPPPLEKKISQGWFPYADSNARGLTAPPPNLSLDSLHPALAEMMRRCFEEGHTNPHVRPLPAEWEAALSEAEKALRTCPNRHVYAGHLPACPLCGAQSPASRSSGMVQTVAARTTISHTPPSVAVAPLSQPVIPAHSSRSTLATPKFSGASVHTCSVCHTLVLSKILYCPSCGNAISPKNCPYCGYMQVPYLAKCCPNCGKPA
jgi:DNA-binding helix-hairpin-helix protein with protein kinase domain